MTLERYFFYRGEMVSKFANGWVWVDEMTWGLNTGPIYKTQEDARNAIRKHLDSTHKAEPRVVGTWRWDMEKRDWFPVENLCEMSKTCH